MSAYTVRIIGERDHETLLWLSKRGYDAGFYDLATLEQIEDPDGAEIEEPDGERPDAVRVYSLTEPDAWQFKENYDADPDAFLACCGSDTLQGALVTFLDSIV